MESDWALIEFRPGRFAKVTPDGTVIGIATEAEARAWFAARGWVPDEVRDSDQPGPALSLDASLPALKPPAATLPPAPSWLTGKDREPGPADQPRDKTSAGPAPPAVTPPSHDQAVTEVKRSAPAPEPPGDGRLDHVVRSLESDSRPQPPTPALEARPTAARPQDSVPSEAAVDVEAEPEPELSGPEPDEADWDEWSDLDGGGDSLEAVAGYGQLSGEADIWALEGVASRSTAGRLEDHMAASELPPSSDGGGWWLWVDPRREPGYSPVTFDLAAFLRRASKLFQTKTWARGQKPARLAAHPEQVALGLQDVADELGLVVVSDPKVSVGTYMLGLEQRTGGE